MRVRPSRQAERHFWNQGRQVVAGIDEVGRGALAGPVVAAAVVLPAECRIPGVADSKQLTAGSRERAARLIKARALGIGLGWVSNHDVDEHGLSWAVRQSGLRALSDLRLQCDAVILDGNHNYLADLHLSRAIIKADQTSLCVAAASIVAKVARDRYMQLVCSLYPEFGFGENKGYGTKAHRLRMQMQQTPLHRRSWQVSFREYLKGYDVN